MPDQALKTKECPNCHHPLSGEEYCPQCGQKNDSRRLSLLDLIRDSLSNIFALDGKIIHTLKRLLMYPGQVPLEYRYGKRMRYMSPVRLYFLSSLILLFIIEVQEDTVQFVDFGNSQSRDLAGQIDFELEQDEERKLTLDSLSNTNKEQLPRLSTQSPPDEFSLAERFNLIHDHFKLHGEQPSKEALQETGLPNTIWNRILYDQVVKLSDFNSKQFNDYLYSKLFWVFFLFVPIIALILRLLYVRRDFYYSEHLFFSFYSQGFFFMVMSLVELINKEWAFWTMGIIFLIYQFLAMKRFFGQSNRKTFFKFMIFNFIGVISFLIFFSISTIVVFILQ